MKNITGLATRIALVRADTGMTQHVFARMALSPNASAKNIGRLEQGEVSPRKETLAKLASFADVSEDWLLTGNVPLHATRRVRTAGFGARVREARLQRGLSARALAKSAGLGASAKNVTRLENREHLPTGNTVIRLAQALNVNPMVLAAGPLA